MVFDKVYNKEHKVLFFAQLHLRKTVDYVQFEKNFHYRKDWKKMNGYFTDEQTMREIVEAVGKTAAATCISAILGAVVHSLVSTKATEVIVEQGIPTEIYTIGKRDEPSAVYISTRRSKTDLKPALFFGAVFLGCKYFLDYRDKNIANVK